MRLTEAIHRINTDIEIREEFLRRRAERFGWTKIVPTERPLGSEQSLPKKRLPAESVMPPH